VKKFVLIFNVSKKTIALAQDKKFIALELAKAYTIIYSVNRYLYSQYNHDVIYK